MIIQSLLLVSLLIGTCEISANGTPPNKKGRASRAKDTPRPPAKGANAAAAPAAEPAASPEAQGKDAADAAKREELVRECVKFTGLEAPAIRRLLEGKAQVVGNGTLKDIQFGAGDLEKQVSDLTAKLAAAERELKAANSRTADVTELARQSEALRAKMAEVTELGIAKGKLETRVQELSLERDMARGETETALGQHNELTQRFHSLKKQFDLVKAAAEKANPAELEAARKDVAEKAAEISKLQEQLKQHEDDTEKLVAAAREADDKFNKANAAASAFESEVANLKKASEAAAKKVEDLARELKNKEAEVAALKVQQGAKAPAGNGSEADDKRAQANHAQALEDAVKKQYAAEQALADAKRALDEANNEHAESEAKIKEHARKTFEINHKEREAAQSSAKFYKNLGMTAAGALAVGGGALIYRFVTTAPRLATRVKADEMVAFITKYEGAAGDLVTMVVKNFGEPAKSDRAMFTKLDSKLVASIDLLEEFLSWKKEPATQEFIEAEEALLRLLMVRAALLKQMPADEPAAETTAPAAA